MIKSITVQISKRRTLELTLDQARRLYEELDYFFGHIKKVDELPKVEPISGLEEVK